MINYYSYYVKNSTKYAPYFILEKNYIIWYYIITEQYDKRGGTYDSNKSNRYGFT